MVVRRPPIRSNNRMRQQIIRQARKRHRQFIGAVYVAKYIRLCEVLNNTTRKYMRRNKMKIKVYSDNPETEEKELCLRLLRGVEGVQLVAVDNNGLALPRGFILEIREGQKGAQVHFRKNLNPDIGFDIDNRGEALMGRPL
jgi:hypothetical protein